MIIYGVAFWRSVPWPVFCRELLGKWMGIPANVGGGYACCCDRAGQLPRQARLVYR